MTLARAEGLRWVFRFAVGTVTVLLIVAASRVNWEASPDSESELRLSWRYVSPTVEACRPPTDQELSGLPQHMRPSEICEGGPIPFSLRIALDGQVLREGPVVGGGERAISIYERFDVTPGNHDLAVDFWPDTAEVPLPEGLAQQLRRTVPFTGGRAILLTLGELGFEVRNQVP
ncbi:MAG: hypothetical protein ACR2QM_19680 [Longimicrobiales bacterium]